MEKSWNIPELVHEIEEIQIIRRNKLSKDENVHLPEEQVYQWKIVPSYEDVKIVIRNKDGQEIIYDKFDIECGHREILFTVQEY